MLCNYLWHNNYVTAAASHKNVSTLKVELTGNRHKLYDTCHATLLKRWYLDVVTLLLKYILLLSRMLPLCSYTFSKLRFRSMPKCSLRFVSLPYRPGRCILACLSFVNMTRNHRFHGYSYLIKQIPSGIRCKLLLKSRLVLCFEYNSICFCLMFVSHFTVASLVTVCEYYCHIECKEFAVSDCQEAATYSLGNNEKASINIHSCCYF